MNHPNKSIVAEYSSLLNNDGDVEYRDLNKNGKLDVYEDPRQPVERRVEDLLDQMTLEEKAGLLFIDGTMVNADGSLEDQDDQAMGRPAAVRMLREQHMNHFNLWDMPRAQVTAKWYNRLQQAAEATRLGVPATMASDPRNHFTRNIFSMAAVDFSQWCETLGFGALDDAKLVRQFADVARREYLAVGFRVALHPQVDLATEPRWPRISGTFGEDAHVAARLVQAYIAGFQGGALGPESVACMTKHFPGGGPQNEGLDPHFKFHKGQVYPGGNFDYHLIPFEAAIRAGTAAMMPYYGVPVGQTDEEVAMSFNKAIISGLLRGKYGFEGVVCTDWGLITDHRIGQVVWEPRAWGVEHLSEAERVGKALEAGVDMFGGESCPQHVVELVRSGRLDERRVDESARRVLRLKFQLGLFDQPFVDEGRVDEVMGDPMSMQMGAASQRRAMVMLSNRARRPSAGKQAEKTLPLEGKPRIYVEGMQTETAAQYGEVVGAPEEAEFAIVRVDTPWVAVETDNPFARNFHHGDLDFKGEAKAHLLDLMRRAPTIVVIYLDRPAVIPEIAEQAAALVGEFGASDEAVLDVLFGRAQAEGRLPFELPGSMEAVRRQKADVPHDSEEAMFPFGFREE